MPSTNYPAGVTNAAEGHPLGKFPEMHPGYCHTFFNDFDTLVAADWTKTGTGTQALTPGDGGLLLLTNSAASGDVAGITQINLGFTVTSSTAWWAMCRVKIDDAALGLIMFGLVDTLTAANPANGVYLTKAQGAGVRVGLKKASTSTQSATGATLVANDTYCDLAISFDPGEQKVRGWLNGATVATMSDLTNLPTVPLGVGLAIQNSTAAARIGTLDWIMAAKQRIYYR